MRRKTSLCAIALFALAFSGWAYAATCWEVYSSGLLYPSTAPADSCDTAAWQNPTGAGTAHIVGISSAEWTLLNTFGIDWNIVYESFGDGLLLFVVGAGIGLVINTVKKARG